MRGWVLLAVLVGCQGPEFSDLPEPSDAQSDGRAMDGAGDAAEEVSAMNGDAAAAPDGGSVQDASGPDVVFNPDTGAVICDPGFADCDHDWTNGCETNIFTDVMRCGGCTGHMCPVGDFCIQGVCR